MIEELLNVSADKLPNYTKRMSIPNGRAGTVATIEEMRKCVDQGKRDFRIRTLGGEIIRDVPEKDYAGYAAAVHNWIRDNVKYALDPAGIETIEYPAHILDSKVADCDSSSILCAALNESLGLESRFRAIKADSNKPDEFSHVFAEVFIPGKGWMASDCSMPNGFGWRPPDHYGAETWPASHDKYEDHGGDQMMKGLGSFGDDADTAYSVVEGILDGSWRDKLVQWQADLDRQTQETNAISTAANSMTDKNIQAQAKAQVSELRNSIYTARLQFVQARNQYDSIAGELNRLGMSVTPIQAGFSGMSGLGMEFGTLGVLPAVIVDALVIGSILVAACIALAILGGSISDAIRGNDSILVQLKKLIEAGGGAVSGAPSSVSTLALIAAGGVGLYLLYKLSAKKGWV